jgi:hypothetical protein
MYIVATRAPNDDGELLGPALNGTIGVLKSAKDRYICLFSFFLVTDAIQTVLP